MKKKVFFSALFSAVLLTVSTAMASEIKVTFDGEELSLAAPPQMINDRVMLPVRAVFEKLGAKVTWDDENKCATAIRDARYVQLSEGNDYMYFGVCLGGTDDGELSYATSEKLDSVPFIEGGTMFVPARAAAEAFYYGVNWNAAESTVEITTPSEADGWIYYSCWNDGGHMYKVDTNGQNRQKLSDDDCYSEDWRYSYIDDYIYFSKRNEDKTKEGILYRIKNDGTDELKLTERPAQLVFDFQSEKSDENRYKEVYFIEAAEDYELSASVMGTSSSDFYGYLKRIDTETGETVQLVEELICDAEMYGDYIYFKYYGDTIDKLYTFYRIDKDGSNLINVTGDKPVSYIRFNSKDDKLIFSVSDKTYSADLDGSNVEVMEDIYSYVPDTNIRKKYEFVDVRTVYLKEERIYVGKKADDNHIYVVDENGDELFSALLPENIDLDDMDFDMSGEEFFCTVTAGEWQRSKIYAETIDELAGMKYISISEERVDGKYEITDEYGYMNSVYIPAEADGVYRIGADGSCSMIAKGYVIIDIKDDKLILADINAMVNVRGEENKNIMLYQSDYNGNNMKEYMTVAEYYKTKNSTVSADDKKEAVRIKEDAHYGIIVRNDGAVSSYNGEIRVY